VNVLSVINEDIGMFKHGLLTWSIDLTLILGPSADYYLITLVFTLVTGVLLLVVGRLSDIIGRRYFMIGGQLIGIIGAIICAKATSINMVIGGTVLSACAGSVQTLYPLLIQELVPNKHRPFGLAAIALGIFPTIGGGPIIARAFVENTVLGWRYVINTVFRFLILTPGQLVLLAERYR
jgi:MFS family permease